MYTLLHNNIAFFAISVFICAPQASPSGHNLCAFVQFMTLCLSVVNGCSPNTKALIPVRDESCFLAVPPYLTDIKMVELVGFEPTTS